MHLSNLVCFGSGCNIWSKHGVDPGIWGSTFFCHCNRHCSRKITSMCLGGFVASWRTVCCSSCCLDYVTVPGQSILDSGYIITTLTTIGHRLLVQKSNFFSHVWCRWQSVCVGATHRAQDKGVWRPAQSYQFLLNLNDLHKIRNHTTP